MADELSREEVSSRLEEIFSSSLEGDQLEKAVSSIPKRLDKFEGKWGGLIKWAEQKYGTNESAEEAAEEAAEDPVEEPAERPWEMSDAWGPKITSSRSWPEGSNSERRSSSASSAKGAWSGPAPTLRSAMILRYPSPAMKLRGGKRWCCGLPG